MATEPRRRISKRPVASIALPSHSQLGPAMNALTTDKQRAFVIALFALGTNDATAAARMAGYRDSGGDHTGIRVLAHRMMHDPRIIAAMEEEGRRRTKGMLPLALKKLEGIVDNDQHRKQFDAIAAVMNRSGLHEVVERKTTIELTTDEKTREIIAMAEKLGLDPKKLLGNVVDAEFTVVDDQPAEDPWDKVDY